MSSEFASSLFTLPVELLYRILDQLDTKDILFSFRNVCQYFHGITNTYNRYTIRFVGPSCKTDIERICRIIRPSNVVKFSMSYPWIDIIELFFSVIDIHQFTRLHSLDVQYIDENDLNKIIHKFAAVSTLVSLSLKMSEKRFLYDDTLNFLSSIIQQGTVQKLFLHVNIFAMHYLSWPDQCALQELNIHKCTDQQFCHILDHSANLRTFILDDCDISQIDGTTLSTVYRQLTSLKLKNTKMSIDQIESLVSLVPSLINLDITQWKSSFAFLQGFSQWEQFISRKLPQLEKFNCYIYIDEYCDENIQHIETIIGAFRTPFWLEHKRWFITCKYIRNAFKSDIIFYSSMDIHSAFPDKLDQGILSYYSSPTRIDDTTKIKSLCSVRLNLTDMIKAIILNEFCQPTDYIFRNIDQLVLDINGKWRSRSVKHLSTLMDLTKLSEIYLFLTDNASLKSNIVKALFAEACNVRILGISYDNNTTINIEDISSVVFHQINHLKVRTKDIDCLKLILERVEHLPLVTFVRHWSSSSSWTEIIQWINEKEKKFSVINHQRSLQIWFDKNVTEQS